MRNVLYYWAWCCGDAAGAAHAVGGSGRLLRRHRREEEEGQWGTRRSGQSGEARTEERRRCLQGAWLWEVEVMC